MGDICKFHCYSGGIVNIYPNPEETNCNLLSLGNKSPNAKQSFSKIQGDAKGSFN